MRESIPDLLDKEGWFLCQLNFTINLGSFTEKLYILHQSHLPKTPMFSVQSANVMPQLLLPLFLIVEDYCWGRHWWPRSRQNKTNRFSNDKKEIDLSWNYLVLCQYLLIYCFLFVLRQGCFLQSLGDLRDTTQLMLAAFKLTLFLLRPPECRGYRPTWQRLQAHGLQLAFDRNLVHKKTRAKNHDVSKKGYSEAISMLTSGKSKKRVCPEVQMSLPAH